MVIPTSRKDVIFWSQVCGKIFDRKRKLESDDEAKLEKSKFNENRFGGKMTKKEMLKFVIDQICPILDNWNNF